ncbi:MAG: phage holin family protein [Ramlibacter sp.]
MTARLIVAIALSLHLLMPAMAWAQTVTRNPLDYSLKQYGLVLGISLLGGFAAFYSKVRRGEVSGWSVHHLMGELATSALAGLLAFWICEAAGFQPLLTAAASGIAGHMGTKAISLFEQYAISHAKRRAK